MRIPTHIFYEAYRDAISKFDQEFSTQYGSNPSTTQIFKLQGYEKDKMTLEDSMKQNSDVYQFLTKEYADKKNIEEFKINSRYLYDKKNRLDKQTVETVKINAPYDRLLFLYLGHSSFTDYKNRPSIPATLYTGYYYSYKQHQIRTYKLEIDYKQKPNYPGVSLQHFKVKEEGFHDNLENEYAGYAYLLEGKLQLIMWLKKDGDRLRIVLESGDNPEANTTMRGSVLAVSSFVGRPLANAETVLVKENKNENSITEEDRLRIKRYLLLHRYNFRINSRPLNLQRMDAKGVGVDVLRHFVDVWRVFRYNDDYSQIVHSALWVREDYIINCFTNSYEQGNLNEQVCLPNITIDAELNTRTICLECFPKEGAKIISYLMLTIPNKSEEFIRGVITFVGQDGELPSMRAIVLQRDRELSTMVAEKVLEKKTSSAIVAIKYELRSPKSFTSTKKAIEYLKEIEEKNSFLK